MTAYVLIQKMAGADPIAEAIRALPGIVHAEDLTGAYDAIALATAASSRDLFERVLPEIRGLPAVTRALPAPVAVADHGEPRAA